MSQKSELMKTNWIWALLLLSFTAHKYLDYKDQDAHKNKIRRTCESYLQIKRPCRYKETTKNLNSYKNIILKQKRHGVVILGIVRITLKTVLKFLIATNVKSKGRSLKNYWNQNLKKTSANQTCFHSWRI